MYIVKNSKGETVLICTRKEDAEAFASTNIDDTNYTIEESNDD